MDKFFLSFPFQWMIFVDEYNIDFFLTVDVLLSSNVILVLDEEHADADQMKKYKLIQGINS